MMNPHDFKEAMSKLNECDGDPESNHVDADDLMCRVLDELGYGEGIKIFKAMRKWYA